jgi:hypothetical protein
VNISHKVMARAPLASPHAPGPAAKAPAALLDPRGARTILGARLDAAGPASAVAPRADTLCWPRGACLAPERGPGLPRALVVADTDHHRLLVWLRCPVTDHEPADLVVGQPGFHAAGRNAGGDVGPATLHMPTGVAIAGDVLAVADAWNHRVLLWHGLPDCQNRPADVVIGQANFRCALANRGASRPGPGTLKWPYGVSLHGGRLWVADTGNRRVLAWDGVPERNGTPADRVLGQRSFDTNGENAGGPAGARGMRWPHAIAFAGTALLVADAGNSRVMAWRALPGEDGAPCDFVLGQAGVHDVGRNRGADAPTAATMSLPYGIAVRRDRCVVVADTANSRLLGFRADGLEQGAPAAALAGQPGFADQGDNRRGVAARGTLCWPCHVTASGNVLVVADAGNNRVLLWEAAPA